MVYKKENKDVVAKFNKYEATLGKSEFMNGVQYTSLDKDALEDVKPHFKDLNPVTHPNLFSWYCLVSKFNDKMLNSLPKVVVASTPKEADDDMDDLFGDDDEDDAEAAKKAAEAAKDAAKKKKKKEVIAMSLVMLEVKPIDDQVDLDALAPKIFEGIT